MSCALLLILYHVLLFSAVDTYYLNSQMQMLYEMMVSYNLRNFEHVDFEMLCILSNVNAAISSSLPTVWNLQFCLPSLGGHYFEYCGESRSQPYEAASRIVLFLDKEHLAFLYARSQQIIILCESLQILSNLFFFSLWIFVSSSSGSPGKGLKGYCFRSESMNSGVGPPAVTDGRTAFCDASDTTRARDS